MQTLLRLALASIVIMFSGCEGEVVQKRKDHSGYKGNPDLWREALICWQEEISIEIKSEKFDFAAHNGSKDVEFLKSKYPDLPKSYLDFIEAGGQNLRSIASGEVDGINLGFASFIDPHKVDYYRLFEDGYLEWKEMADGYLPDIYDQGYFDYSVSNLNFNASEFSETFIVGQEGSRQGKAVYLLNPTHKSIDGEWEGWYWYPSHTGGAVRYRSFAHLVAQKYIYDRFLLEKSREISLHFDESNWDNLCLSKVLEKNWIAE